MPKIAVIAIRHPTEPNLFLHGLRRDNGKFALAGGHFNEGETPKEAARRELEEETGLKGVQLNFLANEKFKDHDVHLFCCDCPEEANFNSEQDPDSEFLTFKWLDPNEIKNAHVPKDRNILIRWMTNNIQKSIISFDESFFVEDLEKTGAPTKAGEISHDGSKVAKVHQNGTLMWHSSPAIAANHDRILNDQTRVNAFLSTLPEHHRPTMKGLINQIAKDPNRHFIPTLENNSQKLRARHIKDLIYGSKDITIDSSDPSVLKIKRGSHSTGKFAGSQIEFNIRNSNAKLGKTESDDRRRVDGDLPLLWDGLRLTRSLYSGGGVLHRNEGSRQSFAERDSGDSNRQGRLEKGVKQRLFPVNKEKQARNKTIGATLRQDLHGWQGGGESEYLDSVAQYGLKPNEMKRAVIDLSGKTKTRKNPQTGELEFLLHRGVSLEERQGTFDESTGTRSHDGHSSWTPNIDIAQSFANKYREGFKQGGVASAWIPHSAIATIPKYYGSYNREQGPNTYSGEHEVIVKPGKYKLETNKNVKTTTGYDKKQGKNLANTLDRAINRRGDTDSLEYKQQITRDLRTLKSESQEFEDLSKARPKVHIEPFTVSPEHFNPKKHDFSVSVKHGDKKVAYMYVTHKKDGIMPFQFHVDKEHRRKGYGTAIAKIAETAAKKGIVASPDMTRDAKAWFEAYKTKKPQPIKKSEDLTGKVFVACDGDGIGAGVERAALKDDLDEIKRQSAMIHAGNQLLRKWAEKHGGEVYIDGGDDVSFTLPLEETPGLDKLREMYFKVTGHTITIGIGSTVSQAAHAMVWGKLNGKNQVNKWSPELQEDLDSKAKTQTPEEKLREEGLIKNLKRMELVKSDEDYKKKAASGITLLHPVTMSGKTHRENGVPLHMTIKAFGDSSTVNPKQVQQHIEKFTIPGHVHEAKLLFMPHKFSTPEGHTHHVLLVYGAPKHIEHIREGSQNYGPYIKNFLPHISVDKQDWDKFSKLGPMLTADQVGIKIHPAELRQGSTVLKKY